MKHLARWQWTRGALALAPVLVLVAALASSRAAAARTVRQPAVARQTADGRPGTMQGRLDSLPAEVRPCMGCHLNPGLALSYRDSTGHLHQASIDLAAYEASIHFHSGERACGDCHTGDYSRVPHPADNPQPTCLSCHDDYRQEYASIDAMAHRSVHYAPDAPMDFDCGTCHSPHSMRPARELTVADRNAACIDCHEHRYNPSGLTLAQRHAWHPQAALHLDRIACIDCHTQPAGAGYAFRHDILPKEQATSDCYACHGANTKMTAYMGSYEGGRPQPYTRGQLLEDYYISGGTRSPLLDRLGLLFMLLVALGTGLHGLLRWCANRRGWCAFMQIGSETP